MPQDVLEFCELENPDGGPPRSLAVTGAHYYPLDYDTLEKLPAGGSTTFLLRWHGGRVLRTDIPGVSAGANASGNATLQSPLGCKAFGLVRGGWLPSVLAAHNDTLVLPDRCVVTDLRGRFAGGEKRDDRPGDFIDLFATSTLRINPLFFALEGNMRRVLTEEEVRQQWEEAAALLQSALPRSSVLALNDILLKGTLGLLKDSSWEFGQKEKFLLRIAPLLAAPVGRSIISSRWQDVLSAADEFGIRRQSIILLAVLSTILMPNGRSPARRLLKFRPRYSEADAYNALADLRAIDILMHLFSIFPHEPVMLCTTDRDLALFWTGLGASKFKVVGRQMAFDLSPGRLVPGVTATQWDDIFGRG